MMITSSSDPFADDHGRPASPTETLLPEYSPEADVRPPESLPPNYALTERPTQPRIYTFSSRSNTSMDLLPSRDVDRMLRPIYNVSVTLNLNPFTPLSYVTTIRRGSDELGELVGEFELGVMHSRGILRMNNRATRMASVLKKDGHSPRKFRWQYANIVILWDCRTTLDDGSPMCICSDINSHQIATFVPPPPDPPQPPPAAVLTVFPDGHELFDHILLSALVVERKLTSSS